MRRKSSRQGDPNTVVPPQAIDAEKAVIGAILQDHDAFVAARAILTPDDFYRQSHGLIFGAACDVADHRGERVDLITVTNELRRAGHLEEVGGAADLSLLVEAVPTSATVQGHARIVVEKSRARSVADLALRLYHAASSDNGWAELADEAQTVLSAKDEAYDFSFRRLDVSSFDLEREIEVPYIARPILVRGDIGILAARWGRYKTWLLLDLLLAAVSGGRAWGRYDFERPFKVLLLDEDTGKGRIERRLCELARGRGFDSGRLKEIGSRLLICADSGFNFRRPDGVKALVAEVDKFRPDLLLIETLARVQKADDENASTDADRLFDYGLKPLARERGITIAMTHHFNKRSGSARFEDPGERIRGSGGIPDFADQVFALVEGEHPDEARLIHVKTREAERAPDLLVKLVAGEQGGLVLTSRLPNADRRVEGPISKVAAAKEFCLANLAQHGEDGLTREALIKLGSAGGFSEPTIKRGINALLTEEMIAAVSHERGAALRVVEGV